MLSLAIGALQLMLDRGELKDWFGSTEIWIEVGRWASSRFYALHRPHVHAPSSPSSSPGMFKDRNFVTGLLFIFIVGIVLLATLALLPPMLQNLMGYPVLTAGYRAGAARRRHDDRDVRRRPADRQGRRPHPDPDRACC